MPYALKALALTLMLAILGTGAYAVYLSHLYVVFTIGTPPLAQQMINESQLETPLPQLKHR